MDRISGGEKRNEGSEREGRREGGIKRDCKHFRRQRRIDGLREGRRSQRKEEWWREQGKGQMKEKTPPKERGGAGRGDFKRRNDGEQRERERERERETEPSDDWLTLWCYLLLLYRPLLAAPNQTTRENTELMMVPFQNSLVCVWLKLRKWRFFKYDLDVRWWLWISVTDVRFHSSPSLIQNTDVYHILSGEPD